MRLRPLRHLPTLLAAFALGASVTATTPAFAGPIHTVDLRARFGEVPATIEGRRAAYDELVAMACLQGLANRAGPNVYVFYTTSAVQAGLETDQLWFDRLADPSVGGDIRTGREVVALPSVEAAIDAYAPLVKGLVVWDENVPATVNAAFAAAGADDLIAVRYDPSPDSLHQRLAAKLPVVVSLVDSQGASRFRDKAGSALVPDTNRQTSQSAKADVHVWVLEQYLKKGKLNPTEMGWMLDGVWVKNPNDYNGNAQPTHQLQVPNRDLLVARRGAAFDLSPWTDVAPTDDPGQPVGTDPGVLSEWLTSARSQTDEVISIRGFFAWQFKYTTLSGLPAGHEPVLGEWTSVKHVSPFGAGLDADAPGLATMANASFFAHVPVAPVPKPQRRPTPEDLVGNGFLRGLASNGGFEDGDAGWTLGTTNRVVYADPKTGSPRSHTGLRYLECNTDAPDDPAQSRLTRSGPAVPAGTTVTLRGFVRAPAGPVTGTFAIDATGGSGAVEHAETSFTATSSWSEVRVTLPIANDGHTATTSTIHVGTKGTNLDLDDVAFFAGDAAALPVENATYLLWFAGDFDAASWMYGFSPTVWDASDRGLVPLAWDFAGHVADRFPPFFRHVLATRSSRDFFIGADTGAGYGNPSQMNEATRAIWQRGTAKAARVLDTSSLWVLDPLASLDAAHFDAVSPSAGEGAVLTTTGLASPSMVGNAAVTDLIGLGGDTPEAAATFALANTPATPSSPAFRAFRAVLKQPSFFIDTTHRLSIDNAGRKIRVVDPFTYFYLAKHTLGAKNNHRASFEIDSLTASSGAPIDVSFVVHNDGWETWRSGGDHPVRIGLDARTTIAAPGSLPKTTGSYATRVSLPHDIAPGESIALSATLPAQTAGDWFVQFDGVEEGVTWFETTGDLPAVTTLQITAAAGGGGGAGGPSTGGAGAGGAQAGGSQGGSAGSDPGTAGAGGTDGGGTSAAGMAGTSGMSAGQAGAAGQAGGAGAAGTSGAAVTYVPLDDQGGCGCRLDARAPRATGSGSPSSSSILFFLATLGLAGRRRRGTR